MRSSLVALVALLALAFPAAAQDPPSPPPGFTAYSIGNGPPLFLKFEGETVRTADSPGAFARLVDGRIVGDLLMLNFDTTEGPAEFVGRRLESGAIAGIAFIEIDGTRAWQPIPFLPIDNLAEAERGIAAFQGAEPGTVPGNPFDPASYASSPGVARIEIVPANVTLASNEPRRFVARVFDAEGRERTDADVHWYSAGGIMAADGEFKGLNAGRRVVLALVDGAMAMTTVTIRDPEVVAIAIQTDVPERLAAGSRIALEIDALNAIGRWDLEPDVAIVSSDPAVVAVEGSALLARAPGRASVTLSAGRDTVAYAITVVPSGGAELAITGVPEAPVRTGDVVALATTVRDALPLWSVVEPGAAVWPASDFVAEKPGTYTVVAALGDRVARATIRVVPRNRTGRFHVVGRGLVTTMHTADIWPQNDYVYLGTHMANQVRTYDVSDPATPLLTDSIALDARVINSVKVSRNGRWLAATREGAADRKNGIVLFSLEDPAHPRQVSEYTETVTSGVHNVFWATDSILYLTNDGTGDMHILDVSDPANPREVGRYGLAIEGGKSLHDVWVQDGILWMSYMDDGLAILDVGGGGRGGTPVAPVLLSRIFYPDGPTHNAFRYEDYLFIGDEDFSLEGTKPAMPGGLSADPRGEVHVLDVSDVTRPRYVARYEIPEAGAHNLWVQNGVMYVGFYQGGIRAVDVTGVLRGDLYRQGREIAHFLPMGVPEDAKIPYAPMTWGVFPMFRNGWQPVGDTWYVTDYNSGLWSMRLEIEGDEPIS